ncbi:MAG: hypothetical protein IKS32_04830 [Solobacterium sp.]|nr:hypothetical protein [Solobacterium sp.]
MSEKKQGFLSQPISFGRKGEGKGRYPTKNYINLIQEKNKGNNIRAIILFVLFMIVLAIFVRIAVIGQLDKIARAEAQYRTVERQVQAIRSANNEYDEVKSVYDDVTDWYMTEAEKAEVDKNNVFKMLEEDMYPFVGIQQVQIAGRTITVTTTVTNLNTVSRFLSILQNDPRNGFVTVTTASANNAGDENRNDVIATVIITYGGGEGGN